MNNYRKLADEVLALLVESGHAFNSFQQESGLTCPPQCGQCCLNPEVSASMIEMLPLALHLIDTNLTDQMYEKFENNPRSCIFYLSDPENEREGRCQVYPYRACICRSFGASARTRKTGEREWVICKIIKKEHAHLIIPTPPPEKAPIIGSFASRVMTIDPILGSKLYPINEALKLMMDKILLSQTLEKQGM